MQTEPIGFKGTKGEFRYEYDNDDFGEFFKFTGTTLNFPYNGIGLKDIGESDAKLMVASKKMAIALQNILPFVTDDVSRELIEMCGEPMKRLEEAKEALKEAGL